MTRISKRPLNKDVWNRIWEIFLSTLSSLKRDSATDFVDDLLSETEKVMLAKRLSIALMTIKGYGPTEISDTLKVSQSTVNNVKKWLNLKGGGYRTTLEKIIRQEKIGYFFQELDNMLSKMGHPKQWDTIPSEKDQLKRNMKRLL